MVEFLQNFLTVGRDGLQLLATAVLPVLFPFFVLTSLILNLTDTARPWLVCTLAYCSGYPNGARLTQNLYAEQRIDLTTAKRLLVATATPSPMFVIATTGLVFLHNLQLGCVIFLCAVIGAIINGRMWYPHHKPQNVPIQTIPHLTHKSFSTAFSTALTSATTAIINVCGVVLFFYIFTHTLHFPVFVSGLLEMTTGTAATINPFLIQFFVTFGGLSVAMQQQLFMQNLGIKFGTYLAYKLTHAVIACGLFSLYWLFLN